MTVDFCVPAYNEDEIFPASSLRIWQFLQALNLPYEWRLVFIVNGSTQAFKILVQNFVNQNRPQAACFIVAEAGKGRAIKTYFNQSEADILVYMDIDLAVDLNDLPALLSPLLSSEVDLCFGSRMMPGSIKNRSWVRESSSRAYLYLSRLWFFDTELIYFSLKHNLKIKEIPVNWSENRYSQRRSKIKVWREAWVFLQEVVNLRWRAQ